MSDNAAAAPSTSPLQFDRAVASNTQATSTGVSCSMCSARISTQYFTLGESPVCTLCKNSTERKASNARGAAAFFKGSGYGMGAAIAGAALYYAVLKLLNLEIGLVAIAIGYMVGYAIRKGTGGWGARRYQLVGAGLTYFAVGLAYLPFAIEMAHDKKEAVEAATKPDSADIAPAEVDSAALAAMTVPDISATLAGTTAIPDSASVAVADSSAITQQGSVVSSDSAAAATPAVTGDSDKPKGAMKAIFGVFAIFALAFSLPIIFTFGSMPGGLISALIIGFGMRTAWRMTGRSDLTFHGPLRVTP